MRIRYAVLATAATATGVFGFAGTAAAQTCSPGGSYPANICAASVGSSTVTAGGTLHVDGEGFAPNSSVSVYLNGTLLGTATANAAGVFSLTVTVPASFAASSYQLTLVGTNPNGTARQLTSTITVVAAAAQNQTTTGGLPFTGAEIAGMSVAGAALVGGGVVMLVATRRRRAGSAPTGS